MSDEYEDYLERAEDVSELFDRPDINDYFDYYDEEVERLWEELPGGLTEGQLEAAIDIMVDMTEEEWDDIMDEIDSGEFDYWDWFNDQYTEG